MQKLLDSPWQTLSIPFALTPIGQLHQSPPSPVPGDFAVKWVFYRQIPEVAVYHENAEHIRLTRFQWRYEIVEMNLYYY